LNSRLGPDLKWTIQEVGPSKIHHRMIMFEL